MWSDGKTSGILCLVVQPPAAVRGSRIDDGRLFHSPKNFFQEFASSHTLAGGEEEDSILKRAGQKVEEYIQRPSVALA